MAESDMLSFKAGDHIIATKPLISDGTHGPNIDSGYMGACVKVSSVHEGHIVLETMPDKNGKTVPGMLSIWEILERQFIIASPEVIKESIRICETVELPG
ncbi:hypothetical protein KAR91_54005 [Candidatus Pacearchaeota archaeon]|nr:hypothetical protein [Candidatus Pacearchaeota archaeon]